MTSGAQRDQFRRVSANFAGVGRGPAGIDPHVSADDPAQLRQPLHERDEAGLHFRIARGCGHEYADTPHPLALLRARHRRPGGRRAAENRDEIPAASCPPPGSAQHRNGSNECFDRGWEWLRYCNMRCWPMSALGQKRTLARALHVRFTPNSRHRATGLAMSAKCHNDITSWFCRYHLVQEDHMPPPSAKQNTVSAYDAAGGGAHR